MLAGHVLIWSMIDRFVSIIVLTPSRRTMLDQSIMNAVESRLDTNIFVFKTHHSHIDRFERLIILYTKICSQQTNNMKVIAFEMSLI